MDHEKSDKASAAPNPPKCMISTVEIQMSTQQHWDTVYKTKQVREVSWFAPHLERSLALILKHAPDRNARIFDAGAGQSTLVDDLLTNGYRNLTLLDISKTAAIATRQRLGERGKCVRWYIDDVTSAPLPAQEFDVWHDRAVFHFLVEPTQRTAYVNQIRHALKPEGHLILATFAEDGPLKCSGLPVVRYDSAKLAGELGTDFILLDQMQEEHITPSGATQKFLFCHFRRSQTNSTGGDQCGALGLQ